MNVSKIPIDSIYHISHTPIEGYDKREWWYKELFCKKSTEDWFLYIHVVIGSVGSALLMFL
jgi:hypothetical protein